MRKLYAGLDVAGQTTAVCVLSAQSEIVFEATVHTSTASIDRALRPYLTSLELVGQEAGTMAGWLHRGVTTAKYPMRCMDPRYAHSALCARLNKTDRNDAQGLALLLAKGMYVHAHIKSEDAMRIRGCAVLP